MNIEKPCVKERLLALYMLACVALNPSFQALHLLVAPVLSGQSHLLVDNDLAAEGVGTEANSDGNDNSWKNVSNHVP